MATATQTSSSDGTIDEARLIRNMADAMKHYEPSPAIVRELLHFVRALRPQRVTLLRPEDRKEKAKTDPQSRSVITFRQHHATNIGDGTRFSTVVLALLISRINADKLLFAARAAADRSTE